MGRVTRGAAARLQAEKSLSRAIEAPVQLSSPPATPEKAPNSKKTPKLRTSARKMALPSDGSLITPKSSRKRLRASIKEEEFDINELPHNLGKIPELAYAAGGLDGTSSGKHARTSITPKTESVQDVVKSTTLKTESLQDVVDKATAIAEPSPKKSKKSNNYGFVPGTTPYPDWPHPTPEECEEVTRLLSSVHGEVKAPDVVPPPSLEVAGCGEVPSVLDALIRTRLSAATTGGNARSAFQGLVNKYGILEEGIGKGSVNWNKVRLSDVKDIFEAIKCGGLGDNKSKDIKKILEMVWEENQARRVKILESSPSLSGSGKESLEEKSAEIEKADHDILSLDHYHSLSSEEAFGELVKFPGIGAKTASCVLLFCLQRPSFAVDTHVFRFCQWLGWVPPPGHPALLAPGKKGNPGKPGRDTTFAHCEVRIPDHLKYPLHHLFLTHGKKCPRCRANTSETYKGWEEGCVIDHLVNRTGVRKGANGN